MAVADGVAIENIECVHGAFIEHGLLQLDVRTMKPIVVIRDCETRNEATDHNENFEQRIADVPVT